MLIFVEITIVGIELVMRIRNSNRTSDNTTPTTTTNNHKTYHYEYYDTCIISKDIETIRFERPIGLASSDPPDPQLRFKILDSSLGQGS